MTAPTEQELLTAAFASLAGLLTDSGMKISEAPPDGPDPSHDAMWYIEAPNSHCTLLVEAYRRFTPRDADRVLGGTSRLLRKVLRDPIVVVAPWLSPRSQQVLTERGFNYIDLTGNVRLRVLRPSINFLLTGAQHDPNPLAKPPVRLQGSSVNALVRVLVDIEPPYRMVDLARATGLSNAYVSRALDALDDDRLLERDPRSRSVTSVDWRNLIKARAEHYSLFKTNRSQTFIARAGAQALYRQLGEAAEAQTLVTGSFAASEYVQIAAPTQLALYVPGITAFAQRYELMPAQQGANIVLLSAASDSQLQRAHQVASGTFHAGISQVALDCLAGNGRLPEEGEALLELMAADLSAWRLPHLPTSTSRAA